MDAHVIAQLCMLATLILMITGKTPIYLTAITGAAISALVAGFPLAGAEGMTITKMIISGLNPVIADMTGILLFIGIMQATGFLDVIIRDIVRIGDKMGGGVGVAGAGGVAAGVIGALTGFTQPVVTAVITGPAAVRLGVDPNKTAGIIAHAGHIGNLAGIRITLDMKRRGVKIDKAQHDAIMAEIENREYTTTSFKAFLPFVVLFVGFVAGLPIFLVGLFSAMLTMFLAHRAPREAEADMMKGVSLIATPLVATIGFLFMSTVIKEIGMVQTMSEIVAPIMTTSPVLVMFGVAFCTAFMTQSYAASVAVLVPFLQIVLAAGGDPFASAFAAASGAALIQYFLTGGPVAALATVIPVIPGSELKAANAFQRPSILAGSATALVITILLMMFG